MNHWLKGLVAAIIVGAASAVIQYAAEPTHVIEHAREVATTSVVMGLIGGAAYLMKSPLPNGG